MSEDNFITWTTTAAGQYFGVSSETIRSWAGEFSDYLSPTATPGGGKTRLFRSEDMAVFALVSDMKKSASTFKEIHTALEAGQRGAVPETSPEELRAVVNVEQEKRYILQIEHLQLQLQNAQEELGRLKEIERQNVQLRTQLDRLKTVEQRNQELQDEIRQLERQLGRLEGQIQLLKDQNDG